MSRAPTAPTAARAARTAIRTAARVAARTAALAAALAACGARPAARGGEPPAEAVPVELEWPDAAVAAPAPGVDAGTTPGADPLQSPR